MRKSTTSTRVTPGWVKKPIGGLAFLCALVLIGTGVFWNSEVAKRYTGSTGQPASNNTAADGRPDTTKLLAWYPMEESDSSSVRMDVHGSHHYSNVVAPANGAAAGLVGNAVELGKGHFRTASNAPSFPLDVTKDFTVVTWVYIPSGASGDPYLWRTGGGPANVRIQARLDNPDYALITRTEASAEYLINSDDFELDTWQMVTLRYQAQTHTAQLLVDTNIAESDTFATPLVGPTAREARIQGNGAAILLDEQSVWQAYLSDEELAWLYNAGTGRSYADLKPPLP